MQRPPQPQPSRGSDYRIEVVGAPPASWRDGYHWLLRLSWTRTIALVLVTYLGINLIFAGLYLASGGIAHAERGSFLDAFFFSVQTIGTIGYGAMYPESIAANVVVAVESAAGLVLLAMVTGLVFAKFSRPSARLIFSRQGTIAPVNGIPTLSFRLGNQRANTIAEAVVRVVLVRTEQTAEGKTLYRMVDLVLTRDRILSLARAWSVMHPIDAQSPLFGETAESLRAKDAELQISVAGIDDTWMQTVHATHRYLAGDIAWNARHADVLSEHGDVLTLDLRKFHDVEPA